jgi:hypothetical protein
MTVTYQIRAILGSGGDNLAWQDTALVIREPNTVVVPVPPLTPERMVRRWMTDGVPYVAWVKHVLDHKFLFYNNIIPNFAFHTPVAGASGALSEIFINSITKN